MNWLIVLFIYKMTLLNFKDWKKYDARIISFKQYLTLKLLEKERGTVFVVAICFTFLCRKFAVNGQIYSLYSIFKWKWYKIVPFGRPSRLKSFCNRHKRKKILKTEWFEDGMKRFSVNAWKWIDIISDSEEYKGII